MLTSPSIMGALADAAGVNLYQGSTVGAPVSGAGAGVYAPGSYLTDPATGIEYYNIGTLAAPVWVIVNAPTMTQQLTGTISTANILGTSAGQFGHAAGVVLVPAGGAHFTIELISTVAHFKFVTAAFTGGGNITTNQGGGAAITGLVSAANSLGNAASKSVTLVPLSTAAIPNVENGSINLVSSAAFTQPGTAAGSVLWYVNFRVYPTNF